MLQTKFYAAVKHLHNMKLLTKSSYSTRYVKPNVILMLYAQNVYAYLPLVFMVYSLFPVDSGKLTFSFGILHVALYNSGSCWSYYLYILLDIYKILIVHCHAIMPFFSFFLFHIIKVISLWSYLFHLPHHNAVTIDCCEHIQVLYGNQYLIGFEV